MVSTDTPVYRGNVTGLSYHGYAKVRDRIQFGDQVEIRPVENPYDSRASGVFYDGVQVGWIPKERNQMVSDLLRQGKTLVGVVLSNPQETVNLNNALLISVFEKEEEVLNKPQKSHDSNKEPKKMKVQKLVEMNKYAIGNSAYLEAGRIANNQVAKMAAKKLPMMVRGYADTPLGKLVIANLAYLAAEHFKPDSKQLLSLTQAMQVQAYTELIQELDIEGIIDELMGNNTIKRALGKLPQEAPSD